MTLSSAGAGIAHGPALPGGALAAAVLAVGLVAPALAGANATLIFDASNSMNSPFDGGSRIEATKAVVAQTVPGYADRLDLGLVVFGHREVQSCSDVEVKVTSEPGHAALVARAVGSVVAQGVSSLSQSLDAAARAVRYRERAATIIALADSAGVDNCRIDTCDTIVRLRKESRDLVVHLIAVGANEAEIPHLRCVAATTGGMFSAVESRAELAAALGRALAIASEQRQTDIVELPPRPKPVPPVALGQRLPREKPEGETAEAGENGAAFAPGEMEAEGVADAAVLATDEAGAAGEADPDTRVSVFAPTRPDSADGAAATGDEAGDEPGRVSALAPTASAGAATESADEAAGEMATPAGTPPASAGDAAAQDAGASGVAGQGEAGGEAGGEAEIDPGDGETAAAAVPGSERVEAIADGSDEFSVSLAPTATEGSTILVKRRAGTASAGAPAGAREGAGQPAAASAAAAPRTAAAGRIKLAALIIENTKPVKSGVEWEVFALGDGSTPTRPVARSADALPEIEVPPGEYVVKGKFGHATRTERITVAADATEDVEIVLGAGGLQIDPVNAGLEDPGASVLNTIYAAGTTSSPVADKVPSGKVVYLNAGVYRVESRYGEANAVARADIEVQPGKLVRAKINHRAGPARFRLVSEGGGAALDGVAWQIVTGDGKAVAESEVSAPRMVFAEGAYTVLATHEGRTYSAAFVIKPGEETKVDIVAR